MKISFDRKMPAKADVVVALVTPDGRLTEQVAALDQQVGGALMRALGSPRFRGKRGQILDILAPAGFAGRRILLAGAGKPSELTVAHARDIGGAIAAHLGAELEAAAVLLIDAIKGAKTDDVDLAANLALGARLRSYRFGKYLSKPREDAEGEVAALTIVLRKAVQAEKRMARLLALSNGVYLARDLVNEPASVIYPEGFVARAEPLRKLGVKVEALDDKDMKKLGMNSLLAVGQGSANPPRLLILRWDGGKSGDAPLAFVGKGVCFDSGGLNLKTSRGMLAMKGDMAGAAAVIGAIRALAERKARINAVGIAALVENMPSGRSYKQGDIVKTMSGQTIEVIDTDAEGRMILVDALYYAATRFRPRCMVDLATLTYAVMAAVGRPFSGLLCNSEPLARQLTAAGQVTGERLWRLPLDDAYDKNLESPIADLRQFAPDSEHADSVHGATLLKHFVDGRPWAHLDIADKEFAAKETALAPVGATGYGVALLEQFAAAIEGIA
jgi:leucyl aminopeptidase